MNEVRRSLAAVLCASLIIASVEPASAQFRAAAPAEGAPVQVPVLPSGPAVLSPLEAPSAAVPALNLGSIAPLSALPAAVAPVSASGFSPRTAVLDGARPAGAFAPERRALSRGSAARADRASPGARTALSGLATKLAAAPGAPAAPAAAEVLESAYMNARWNGASMEAVDVLARPGLGSFSSQAAASSSRPYPIRAPSGLAASERGPGRPAAHFEIPMGLAAIAVVMFIAGAPVIGGIFSVAAGLAFAAGGLGGYRNGPHSRSVLVGPLAGLPFSIPNLDAAVQAVNNFAQSHPIAAAAAGAFALLSVLDVLQGTVRAARKIKEKQIGPVGVLGALASVAGVVWAGIATGHPVAMAFTGLALIHYLVQIAREAQPAAAAYVPGLAAAALASLGFALDFPAATFFFALLMNTDAIAYANAHKGWFAHLLSAAVVITGALLGFHYYGTVMAGHPNVFMALVWLGTLVAGDFVHALAAGRKIGSTFNNESLRKGFIAGGKTGGSGLKANESYPPKEGASRRIETPTAERLLRMGIIFAFGVGAAATGLPLIGAFFGLFAAAGLVITVVESESFRAWRSNRAVRSMRRRLGEIAAASSLSAESASAIASVEAGSLASAARRLEAVPSDLAPFVAALGANERPERLVESLEALGGAKASTEVLSRREEKQDGILGRLDTETVRSRSRLFVQDRSGRAVLYSRESIVDGGLAYGAKFHADYGNRYFIVLNDAKDLPEAEKAIARDVPDAAPRVEELRRLVKAGIVRSALIVALDRAASVRDYAGRSIYLAKDAAIEAPGFPFDSEGRQSHVAALWSADMAAVFGAAETAAAAPAAGSGLRAAERPSRPLEWREEVGTAHGAIFVVTGTALVFTYIMTWSFLASVLVGVMAFLAVRPLAHLIWSPAFQARNAERSGAALRAGLAEIRAAAAQGARGAWAEDGPQGWTSKGAAAGAAAAAEAAKSWAGTIDLGARTLEGKDALADLFLAASGSLHDPEALVEWLRRRGPSLDVHETLSSSSEDRDTGRGILSVKTVTALREALVERARKSAPAAGSAGAEPDRTPGEAPKTDAGPAVFYHRTSVDESGSAYDASFRLNYGDRYFIVLRDAGEVQAAREAIKDDKLAELVADGRARAALVLREPRETMLQGRRSLEYHDRGWTSEFLGPKEAAALLAAELEDFVGPAAARASGAGTGLRADEPTPSKGGPSRLEARLKELKVRAERWGRMASSTVAAHPVASVFIALLMAGSAAAAAPWSALSVLIALGAMAYAGVEGMRRDHPVAAVFQAGLIGSAIEHAAGLAASGVPVVVLPASIAAALGTAIALWSFRKHQPLLGFILNFLALGALASLQSGVFL